LERDDLADHVRVVGDVVVAEQRERRGPARAVAGLAVLLDQRLDVLVERVLAGAGQRRRQADLAAVDRRLRDLDLGAAEHRVERLAQVLARRRRLDVAVAHLVVDAAPVAQLALGVEHDRRRRPLDRERLQQLRVLVLDERIGLLVRDRERAHVAHRVPAPDVDADEEHALGLVLGREPADLRQEAADHRAVLGHEEQHERRPLAEVGEVAPQRADVDEARVAARTEGRARGLRKEQGAEAEHGQRRTEGEHGSRIGRRAAPGTGNANGNG
jgi:hypothetical protein